MRGTVFLEFVGEEEAEGGGVGGDVGEVAVVGGAVAVGEAEGAVEAFPELVVKPDFGDVE